MHRLFTCSYEAILGIVSLYYFNEMTDKFDKNLIIVIALQSFSFTIRNTSPIGWVFILLLKAYQFGLFTMLKNYILGFIFIFAPIFGLSVALDSWFYGELAIVPYNFIKVNVLDGLSQTFGSDPLLKYVNVEIPARFNIFFPCVVIGAFYHFRAQ